MGAGWTSQGRSALASLFAEPAQAGAMKPASSAIAKGCGKAERGFRMGIGETS